MRVADCRVGSPEVVAEFAELLAEAEPFAAVTVAAAAEIAGQH